MQGDSGQSVKLTLDSATSVQLVKLQTHTSDYVKKLANEPSIGLFEVQEHVHRAVPRVGDAVRKLDKSRQSLTDATYDVDYSIITVKSWQEMISFQRIKRLMSASIMTLEMMNEGKPPPNFSMTDDPLNKPSPSLSRKKTPNTPRQSTSRPTSSSLLESTLLSPPTPTSPSESPSVPHAHSSTIVD